jgi:hypothetical protein
MYIETFPEEVLALQEEVQQHPELLKQLCQLPAGSDIGDKLGEIAAYCEVILDGMYDNDSLLHLCGVLLKKMQAKRLGGMSDIIQVVTH